MSIVIRIAKLAVNRNNIKFEGYMHCSIDSRSVPVGRLADENVIRLNFLNPLVDK